MTAGSRFKGWVEGVADSWKDRLAGWMVSWASRGLRQTLDDLEPEAIETIKPIIEGIRNLPGISPELKEALGKTVQEGNILNPLIGVVTMLAQSIGVVLGGSAPLARSVEYNQERILRSARFDPSTVLTAWRRDPVSYNKYFDDLRDQGWDEYRIGILKQISEIIPGVQDLIRMSVREAFSPEIAEKFGQYQDPPTAVYPWAEKLGLTQDWVDRYWAAHWELPSSGDGFELLHRGIITEDELKLLLRALDVMPFWRDKLIKLSWNIPTRVDVRRFWDLRTIDEARLREVYTGLGYHGQDLEDYILWTKIFVDFPDLLARYKNGWIEIADVKRELIAMGMKPERAETLIQEKMKNAMIERTATQKDLTKADIISGVKKGVITRAEGNDLLVSIGYSTDEATFILEVGIPTDEEDANVKVRTLTKGDIAAAVKEILISPADAIVKLVALRYKEADATFLAAIYTAQIPMATVEPARALTKGDVATGLKAGIISPEEARIMLAKLRYSAEDITYLLSISQAAAAAALTEKGRQVEKSDIGTALLAGVITDASAISRLVKLQYTEEDATFLVGLYHTIDALSQVTKPLEASKADIVTAVKKGLITPEEGYTMLTSLGYAAGASNFILSIAAEESPFSPMNLPEFIDRTQKWRQAAGLGGKPMTEEIKKLGAAVVRISAEVTALARTIKEEEGKLVSDTAVPVEATARVKELQATLYKAQAELARVKTDYNAKIAEWKHAAK